MNEQSVYIAQWLMLIAVFSLAVISPGPDFVVAVRNSIVHSRRIGILTALGFGFGVLVHVTYTILGFAAIISKSIVLFNAIKWAGASYLIYIGFQALRSKGMGRAAVQHALHSDEKIKSMSDGAAFRIGFLTNALNPKASLFFLAIFSQIIRPTTPISWQVLYGLTCALMVIVWFSIVAIVLNNGHIRNRFLKITKWIDRTCGILMIALGIKVAFTSR